MCLHSERLEGGLRLFTLSKPPPFETAVLVVSNGFQSRQTKASSHAKAVQGNISSGNTRSFHEAVV